MSELTRKQIEDIRNGSHDPSVLEVGKLCNMALRSLNVEELPGKWEKEAQFSDDMAETFHMCEGMNDENRRLHYARHKENKASSQIHAQELKDALSKPNSNDEVTYDLHRGRVAVHELDEIASYVDPAGVNPNMPLSVQVYDLCAKVKNLYGRLSDTELKLYNESKRAQTAEEALDDIPRIVQERVGQALMDVNYWGNND